MGVKTTKPISTISYNTLGFLALKLEELRKAKILAFWVLIQHKGEKNDECQGKDHIHLFMIPAKSVQTVDIEQCFIEPVPDKKPLKTTMIRSSKFDDWALYVLHNRQYLALKGLVRQFEYQYADFITPDEDTLEELYGFIDFSVLSPIQKVIEAVDSGLTWNEFVRSGVFPVQQINAYLTAWNSLQPFNNMFNKRSVSADDIEKKG